MIYNNVAEIYETINETRTSLIALSDTLTAEQANNRENDEGWSVASIYEHLEIIEGRIIEAFEKLLTQAEKEGIKSNGVFDSPVSVLELMKQARGKKFEAPPHVQPQGAQDLKKSLAMLQDNRVKLNALRLRIEATDLTKTAFPHPAFGNLNVYQWLIFIGLHEQRHLAQIKRILTA
jgi:hypothetical protein